MKNKRREITKGYRRPEAKRGKGKSFTLVELLVVIAIVWLLATVVIFSVNKAREKARIVASAQVQRQLQKATELYVGDMGFYPPDVGRGWDPGFAKPLPYNLDNGQDCATNPAACPSCSQCPTDWINQVLANWGGPYIAAWPPNTPWNGEYDYNYWPAGASRYGCTDPPGVYVGIQGDYSNNNTIPPSDEQEMLDKQYDSDGCLNGESQMKLFGL